MTKTALRCESRCSTAAATIGRSKLFSHEPTPKLVVRLMLAFRQLWVMTCYGFNGPSAIASDGTHVWVANLGSRWVTEFSAS
jgi:hypothetical protein